MKFNKWLNTFIEEKGLNTDHVFEVEGPVYGMNFIPLEALVEVIKGAPKHEQEGIKTMIVRLDFANAKIMPYFEHLAKAIAK
jgi:hypothetical protein